MTAERTACMRLGPASTTARPTSTSSAARRCWFAISASSSLAGLVSLVVRGLNLGIDFEGGVVWEVPAGDASRRATPATLLADEGAAEAKVQTLERRRRPRLRVQTEELGVETRAARSPPPLAERAGVDVDEVSVNSVGPSWGNEITEQGRAGPRRLPDRSSRSTSRSASS